MNEEDAIAGLEEVARKYGMSLEELQSLLTDIQKAQGGGEEAPEGDGYPEEEGEEPMPEEEEYPEEGGEEYPEEGEVDDEAMQQGIGAYGDARHISNEDGHIPLDEEEGQQYGFGGRMGGAKPLPVRGGNNYGTNYSRMPVEPRRSEGRDQRMPQEQFEKRRNSSGEPKVREERVTRKFY